MGPTNLTFPLNRDRVNTQVRVVVLGEILWDLFADSTRLGGAPLNFAVHAGRLGCEALLISAVGNDDLGTQSRKAVGELGLDTGMLQTTDRWATGTAHVFLDTAGHPTFRITPSRRLRRGPDYRRTDRVAQEMESGLALLWDTVPLYGGR